MLQPVAIFSTSEIQFVNQGADVPITTGALERALENGFQCYVASTRHGLGKTDAWWVKLVGEENVFLAKTPEHVDSLPWSTVRTFLEGNPELGYTNGWGTIENWRYSSGWRLLYKRLGEVWPRLVETVSPPVRGNVGAYTWRTSPAPWRAARDRLRKLGYVRGNELQWNKALFFNDTDVQVRYKGRKWGPEYVQYDVEGYVNPIAGTVEIDDLCKWVPEYEENTEIYQAPKPAYLDTDTLVDMKFVDVTDVGEIERFLLGNKGHLIAKQQEQMARSMEKMKTRLHEYHAKLDPNCVHGFSQTETCSECHVDGGTRISTIV